MLSNMLTSLGTIIGIAVGAIVLAIIIITIICKRHKSKTKESHKIICNDTIEVPTPPSVTEDNEEEKNDFENIIIIG